MTKIYKHTLSNGVRILVEPVNHVGSASVGLWCRTGSRHETAKEAGITHLIEHMLFKGTATRTAKEIAESIEGRGGSINAFTDKEATCYYCRVLSDDVLNGIDVLTDMMLNSKIDPVELKREQSVVLEEIKRSEDEPSDHVHDLHIEYRWDGHALGKPIIGTRDSVSSFSRDDLTTYMRRRYVGSNVLLAVAGKVDPKEVIAGAEKTLAEVATADEETQVPRPEGHASKSEVSKDVEQVHFCIGTDGCSIYDDELYALAILDGALGGGMSSRLFQEIREKRGLAYSIGSYMLTFSCGGAYTVYGGTSDDKWEIVQELVRCEFDKILSDGLSEGELERTKRNLSGNLVLSLEGMSSRMMRMSRNELNHGREITVEETLSRIDGVTNKDLIELSRRILAPDKVNTTAIGPF